MPLLRALDDVAGLTVARIAYDDLRCMIGAGASGEGAGHRAPTGAYEMAYPYLSDVINALLGTQLSFGLPTFGPIVVAALLAAAFVTRSEVKRYERAGTLRAGTHREVFDLAAVAGLAGFAGARLFHVLDHLDRFLTSPAAMIFSRSGFSIYGGLTFGVIAGIWFLRRRSIAVAPMLDATAPAMMLGYAIGRLACQVAGDGDWGIASNMTLKPAWLPDWLWAQTYDGNILGIVVEPPGVYPTPIYESLAALALFGVLWVLRRHDRRAGFLFSIYLLFAGFERLLIEKIRINTEHQFLGLSLTQAEAVSVVLIVGGLVGALVTLKARKPWARIALTAGVVAALSACVPV